jgi:hypothetical protein
MINEPIEARILRSKAWTHLLTFGEVGFRHLLNFQLITLILDTIDPETCPLEQVETVLQWDYIDFLEVFSDG